MAGHTRSEPDIPLMSTDHMTVSFKENLKQDIHYIIVIVVTRFSNFTRYQNFFTSSRLLTSACFWTSSVV